MLVEKHQLKNGKGTGKLTFSPEALSYIELQVNYVPGMNTPTTYRREGMEAQETLDKIRQEKQEEAGSTKEMRPVLKRKATMAEQLQGKKDEYTYVPHGIGMSGADPLLSFFVGNTVINLPLHWLGKGAVYGLGKYGTTASRNWARGRILGLEMKNSLNNNFLGPEGLLQNWDGKSGPIVQLTENEVKKLYLRTKKDVYNYIHGLEFKDRIINSGQFSNQDYKDLIKEIEEELKKTTFNGLDQRPRAGGNNTHTYDYNPITGQVSKFISHKVKIAPDMSLILHRTNVWHEIWHSIAGGKERLNSRYFPQLSKLKNYNYQINPTTFSYAFQKEQKSITKDFLTREIVNKPNEVRSRMLSSLDFLRLLGYDTHEIVKHPSKFADIILELYQKQLDIPWDLLHLLMTYNIYDLANYASRMLSATGAAYIGNEILNSTSTLSNNINYQTNNR